MPLYKYRCDRCPCDFEIQQSINTAPMATCPLCGTNTFKRLVQQVGAIIFKGWFPGKEIASKEN